MEPSFVVETGARLSSGSNNIFLEDAEWAALASAEGADDEVYDPDCAGVVAAVDAVAVELGRLMSRRVLAAKAALAQKAQARQVQVQAEADADIKALEDMLQHEADARGHLEARLGRAFEVQHRLADSLHKTRESCTSRVAALTVMAEWQRSLAALKREAKNDIVAPRHAARTLLRKCVGRWRTNSRASRHKRIDAFWEHAVGELRTALQGHYEPRLASLNVSLEEARGDAANAWRAKEELGRELKAAFMRGVCQLNLETATILNENPNGLDVDAVNAAVGVAAAADHVATVTTAREEQPRADAPRPPIRPEELLATARRGLQAASKRA